MRSDDTEFGGRSSAVTLHIRAPEPFDGGPSGHVHLLQDAAVIPLASVPVVSGALQTDAARDPIPPAVVLTPPVGDVPAGPLTPEHPAGRRQNDNPSSFARRVPTLRNLPGALRDVSPNHSSRPAEPIDGGQFGCGTLSRTAAVDPIPPHPAGQTVRAPRNTRARRVASKNLPATGGLSPVVTVPADPLGGGRAPRAPLAFRAPAETIRPALTTVSPYSLLPGEPFESGPMASVTLNHSAALNPTAAGLTSDATQRTRAGGGTYALIRERWRTRQAWHRAEKSLTLQAKAVCRRVVGGDKKVADTLYKAVIGKGTHDFTAIARVVCEPLLAARATIEAHRTGIEKELAKLAAQTPGADFVEATRGMGILSLAAILGEAGDLSEYAGPAKLWKRMGLAVMGDGTRQRKVGGVDALDHGYSPRRRSVMWVIGDCLVKAGGEYREVYDARKVYEAARVDAEGKPFRPIVCHLRAKRYAEKRLLRNLWRHWRAA